MKVAPDYNPVPYFDPTAKPKMDQPKHYLHHRMIEGIYA